MGSSYSTLKRFWKVGTVASMENDEDARPPFFFFFPKDARKLDLYTLIYTLLFPASAEGGLTVNVDRLSLVYFRQDAQLSLS
jgi:hypothetical protein